MPTSAVRMRAGAVALAVAGVLFVLYPAIRPWQDESTAAGAAEAMSSGAWIASHLFAMIGFVLVALGLLALRQAVVRTRAEPVALAAVVTGWVGAGLTLPYYGAETFGLHAIAGDISGDQLLELVDTIRFQPVAVTTFGLGLLLLAAAAVLAAVAIWRAGTLARPSGLLLAAGFVLFLPQFYAPPAVRIAHGVLLGAGAGWVGLQLWRAAHRQPPGV